MEKEEVIVCECGSKEFHIIRDSEDDEPLAAWCAKCGKSVKFEVASVDENE